MTQDRLTIIVPVYNEEEVLWQNAETLAEIAGRAVGDDNWQFQFVDNGSVDRTGEILDKIATRWPATRVITLEHPNFGEALRTGLLASETEWCYVTPIDEADLPFAAWSWANRDRYDVIIGSKRADPTLNHQHWFRRILSWGMNSFFQVMFRFTGSETHGAKFLRTHTVRPHAEKCVMRRGQFDSELVLRAFRAGLRIVEVPTPYYDQRPPRNLMITKISRNLVDIFRLRHVLLDVPYAGSIRYYRVAREDLLEAAEHASSESQEMSKVRISA